MQEGIERIRGFETSGKIVSDVHTRGKECHRRLIAVFSTHRHQFVLHAEIFGSFYGEGEPHVHQRPRNLYADVEIHLPLHIVLCHRRLRSLRCTDRQARIQHIASELHIAALLQAEGLEGNDGELIFHFALLNGIIARQTHHALRSHAEGEVAATTNIHVALAIAREEAVEFGTLRDIDVERHVDSHVGRGFFRRNACRGILKADKCDEV